LTGKSYTQILEKHQSTDCASTDDAIIKREARKVEATEAQAQIARSGRFAMEIIQKKTASQKWKQRFGLKKIYPKLNRVFIMGVFYSVVIHAISANKLTDRKRRS